MSTGVYPGLSYEEYVRLPGLRSSYLSAFKRTAKHARHAATWGGSTSKAKELGIAIHAAVLEPDTFDQRYVMRPEGIDRRTNAGKAAFAALAAELATKTLLDQDTWDTALRCRDSVWGEPWAEALLKGRGGSELTVRWEDRGAPCKARIDRFAADFDGHPAVCDLKSTRDATTESFQADVERFQYGLQAAYYLDGLAAATAPHFRRWYWIAVETFPPYCARLLEPMDDILDEGRRLYRAAITAHLECERTGSWPGYASAPGIIGRPRWASSRQLEGAF